MLPHYSAYKVAEQFSVLANLYPGRIDLGVGRAPGADMSTAVALANDGRPKFERFPKQVTDLCSYLWDENTQPMVSPRPPKDLPVWMLGSSADSAQLAALKGLPYNLAAFINPQASSDLIRYYRQSFQPSARCPSPYAVLTMSIFCAETEARAEALAHTFDINFYRFVTGQSKGSFLTPEEAASYPMTAELKGFKQHRSQNRAVGTPDQVKLLLARQARIFEVDEIMAVSNIHNLEDRKRSFELLINN